MYSDKETQTSYDYLKKVVHSLDEPICIVGGWAIFLTVNPAYQQRFNIPYLGSRDIDLGFHFEPKQTDSELKKSAFAKALKKLESEGFESIDFRLVKHLDRETGIPLPKEEYKTKPLFDIIEMYVDLMVDNIPENFTPVFGMGVADEPLIEQVFKNENYRSELVEFDKKLYLPSPTILLSTKLKSLPNRQKDDKRLKDIHDICGVLLFSRQPLDEFKPVSTFLTKEQLEKGLNTITDQEIALVENNLRLAPNEFRVVWQKLKRKANGWSKSEK